MDVIIVPLMQVINIVIDLYIWVVIAGVILSWLTAFNVVNTHNKAVYTIGDVIYRLTEPPLRKIRQVLPDLGAIDLSPIVLILGLMFLQTFLNTMALKLV